MDRQCFAELSRTHIESKIGPQSTNDQLSEMIRRETCVTTEARSKTRRYRLFSIFAVISLFCFPLNSRSQSLRLGGMVSSQTTDTFTHDFSPTISSTTRIAFGPTVELRLLRHLSIEADALYRGG